MKRLLRGVIDWGGLSREGLVANYNKLRTSKVSWIQSTDRKIFKYVKDFHAAELDLPSAKVLVEFFSKIDDIETVERLKDIAAAMAYEGANYSHVLRTVLEDQHRASLSAVLKDTQEIAQKGLVVGEGKEKQRLEGVKEAVLYFQRKAAELLVEQSSVKTRANLRQEAPEAWLDYQKAHAAPEQAVGKLFGIDEIDAVCKGAKVGELWVHAAYSGELKTVTGLNWCYQLVTRYKTSVFFVSLEMPLIQIRNIVCVMHSTHHKWAERGYNLTLEYRNVRDGALTDQEATFYKVVLDDFYTNEDYAHFEVWTPDHDVTVNDIKAAAEAHGREVDLGFIVIDHGGIVTPADKFKDFNIGLNSVIRDAKKLALQFNQGVGIALLLLFQINRQGKDDADKNDGRYKLRALASANEAERSADVVTTSYLDDQLRREGRARYCNLKNRDNPLFLPMIIGIDFATRRLTRVVQMGEDMTSGPDDLTSNILDRIV
jgi:replicative DNA helicase